MSSQELCNILQQATSLDTAKRTEALKILENWEMAPMYHATLQQIYLDANLDIKIRSLAVISLKNGIDKYWRKSAKGAIQQQEKHLIKQNQLQFLGETNRQLATQHAVIIAKIARHDFPNEWPDLLDILMPIVEQSFAGNTNMRFNSLYTLHLVMKTLTAKALPSAKRITQMITPNVFRFTLSVFHTQIARFFGLAERNSADLNELNDALVLSKVALKCLRRLTINGYQKFSEASEVTELFTSLNGYLPRLQTIYAQVSTSSTAKTISNTLNGILILFGKLFLNASSDRVIDFLLLPSSVETVRIYWAFVESDSLGDDPLYENIKIQALKILKNIVKNPSYHVVSEKHGDARLPDALKVLHGIFTQDFVLACSRILLSRYVCMSKSDLELWEDDPESFNQEEESDHWEYNVRGCAEKLYMFLNSKYRELLSPFLVSTLNSLGDPNASNLLFMEGLYCVFGVCAFELYDYFDFDQWFETKLVFQVQNKSPEFKVLRRRIADLIGHWVGVKSAKEKRTVLYEAIISLLVPGEDIVVRLRATLNLLKLLDDFDFEPAQFLPYLHPVVENFKDLLDAVDEFDSKITIINCLIAITERLEGQAVVAMAPLFSVIHNLWLRSEGQNMFRTSIVKILTKFVKTLRSESYQMYEMVAPILQESLDTSNPGHVYLFEEGLELWLATMQNCSRGHQGLLNLVPVAIGLLDLGTETLKKIIHILEAYIVVCPQEIFQSYIGQIITSISGMLENVSAPAISALLKMVDLILQSANSNNVTPALFNVIFTCGFFNKLVSVILIGEDLSIVIIAYMMVLARMILYDANSVLHALESGGQDIVDKLLLAMLDKFDALSHVRQSKLFALSFASLIATGHPKVSCRLGEIFSLFTSVAIQLKDLDRTEAQLFSFEVRNEDDDEFSLDYERRKYLNSLDPLFMEGSLIPYIKSKLGEFEQRVGSPYLNELTSKIDQDIMHQINRMFQ
ncbi:Importin-11 [Boothiomyces sp. JEL0866]|nr:Importin-11 [Boothiomyces sp. JEL0866]